MATHDIRFGSVAFDIADRALDRAPLGADYLAILRAFLSDTIESCGFHRQRWAKAGVTPDQIQSFDDLHRVPKMGSHDVQAISDSSLLPDRYASAGRDGLAGFEPALRLAKKFFTTSSTGRPKASYYTAADWDANKALMDRHMGHLPLSSFSRTFNCFHSGHFGGKLSEDMFNAYGCLVENRHHTYTTEEEVLRQLYGGLPELGGFNCLSIPPGKPDGGGPTKGITLEALLDIDVDNYIGRNIRVISTSGGPLRGLKERVWEANELASSPRSVFIDKLGAAEVGTTAVMCERYDGFHIYQGLIYVEVLDEQTGRHVADGQRGLIAYTGLKHGSRYVRYLVGDEGTYVAERCGCGLASPRIKDVKRVLDKDRIKAGCAAGGY